LRSTLILVVAGLFAACSTGVSPTTEVGEVQAPSCQDVPVPYSDSFDLDRTPHSDASDGFLIPSSLSEALREFDHMLPEDVKASMRCGSEGDMSHYHFALGLWVRNNWGLWAGGPLAEHFRGLGINHPDDMSGIILTSYWRQLQKRPLELDAQVRYYQNYWAAHADPGVFTCPNSGVDTAATIWFHAEIPPDRWVVYHVVDCGEGVYWVYEKSEGWQPASQEVLERIN